jgi:hypothetical protein
VNVATWIAAFSAVTAVLITVLTLLLRPGFRAARKIDQFIEDWNGVPADRGHVARPGVLERMAVLERGQAEQCAQLADVQAQVHVNSGHSLKDAVVRTEAAVACLNDRVSGVQAAVEELKARKS